MNGHRMTETDFQNLVNMLSQYDFGGNTEYKYRIALLIFTVSHDLRPSVGFEYPFENYCLEVHPCKRALENFFQSNNLNLAVTLDPIPLVYNTRYSIKELDQRSDEDEVQWLGRIFGYWVPMTAEEFMNTTDPRNRLHMDIHYKQGNYWITGFDSLKPIAIDWRRMDTYRKVFDILKIPKGGIHISLLHRLRSEEEDNIVAEIYI